MLSRVTILASTVLLLGTQGQDIPSPRPGSLDDYGFCSMAGSANDPEARSENLLKNRYSIPTVDQVDPSITLDRLLAAGSINSFDQNKAASVEGFLTEVHVGGIETVNCRQIDAEHRDVMLEISPSSSRDPRTCLIAEVTPRLRFWMKQHGVDWSADALKNAVGKKVRITGWLFFDSEHQSEAFATDPQDLNGRMNWRATTWEIHPVTRFQVLEEGK